MRRDGQHRHAVAVAVVAAVEQGRVARPTRPSADSARAGEVGLGPGCEGRSLLVTNMHPLDLALAAKCIGQPVQAIPDDAVNPLDAGGCKGFGELICDGLHNLAPSFEGDEVASPARICDLVALREARPTGTHVYGH